jgi:hypothetical protein
MKKFLNGVVYTWFMCAALLVWVVVIAYAINLSNSVESFAVAYVIAPISETLFYLYLPLLLARKITRRFRFDIETPIMLFVAFQFILLHQFNYSEDGRYLACLFQGVMFYFCYIVMSDYWKKGGFWYAVLLHTTYNVGITLLM